MGLVKSLMATVRTIAPTKSLTAPPGPPHPSLVAQSPTSTPIPGKAMSGTEWGPRYPCGSPLQFAVFVLSAAPGCTGRGP